MLNVLVHLVFNASLALHHTLGIHLINFKIDFETNEQAKEIIISVVTGHS